MSWWWRYREIFLSFSLSLSSSALRHKHNAGIITQENALYEYSAAEGKERSVIHPQSPYSRFRLIGIRIKKIFDLLGIFNSENHLLNNSKYILSGKEDFWLIGTFWLQKPIPINRNPLHYHVRTVPDRYGITYPILSLFPPTSVCIID